MALSASSSSAFALTSAALAAASSAARSNCACITSSSFMSPHPSSSAAAGAGSSGAENSASRSRSEPFFGASLGSSSAFPLSPFGIPSKSSRSSALAGLECSDGIMNMSIGSGALKSDAVLGAFIIPRKSISSPAGVESDAAPTSGTASVEAGIWSVSSGVRGASPDAPAAESTFVSSIDPSARGIARDRARDSGETASSTSRRLGDEKNCPRRGARARRHSRITEYFTFKKQKSRHLPPLASALSTRASPVYREFSPLGPSKCLGRSSSSPLSAAPPRTRAPAGNSHAVSIVTLLYQ